jgi:hypothetical protein
MATGHPFQAVSEETPDSQEDSGPKWDPRALEELVEGLAAKQEASHKIWKLYMEETRLERIEVHRKLDAVLDLLQQRLST